MTENLFDTAISRAEKERGMLAAQYSSLPSEDWVAKARSIAEHLAATQGEVTIEHVYKQIGLPPNPNAAGSVFKGKKFRCIGIDEATRISRHAGIIRRWVLA